MTTNNKYEEVLTHVWALINRTDVFNFPVMPEKISMKKIQTPGSNCSSSVIYTTDGAFEDFITKTEEISSVIFGSGSMCYRRYELVENICKEINSKYDIKWVDWCTIISIIYVTNPYVNSNHMLSTWLDLIYTYPNN